MRLAAGGLAQPLCEYVYFCVCVCVLFFLLNSAEGGKATAGVFALQSLVSIIEEWYLEKRGPEEGGWGVRLCTAMEGWVKNKIKNKSVRLCFDESPLYV